MFLDPVIDNRFPLVLYLKDHIHDSVRPPNMTSRRRDSVVVCRFEQVSYVGNIADWLSPFLEDSKLYPYILKYAPKRLDRRVADNRVDAVWHSRILRGFPCIESRQGGLQRVVGVI